MFGVLLFWCFTTKQVLNAIEDSDMLHPVGVGGIEAEIRSQAVLMRQQVAGALVLRVEKVGTFIGSHTLVLTEDSRGLFFHLHYFCAAVIIALLPEFCNTWPMASCQKVHALCCADFCLVSPFENQELSTDLSEQMA